MSRAAIVGICVVAAFSSLSSSALAAENPFTPAEACTKDFGGRWAHVTDGHRSITNGGKVYGDVYLMYDSKSGKNCVTTIKRAAVGEETFVAASIDVQNDGAGWRGDSGAYKYYAAYAQEARDTCVAYSGRWGGIEAGRYQWGNCG